MQPLKVTFRLSAPMVLPDRPIHLDSLIAHAAFRLAERGGAENPLEATHDLPLARETGDGDAWVWQASQVMIRRSGEAFATTHTRRYDLNRWAEDKARGYWRGAVDKIPQGSGRAKAFMFTVPMCYVESAEAWCIGDRDMIADLLRGEIHSLGKLGRIGWGRVKEITVAEAPIGEADWWRRRTLPECMRALCLPEHYAATASVIPPYWDRANWQAAWEYDGASAPASL